MNSAFNKRLTNKNQQQGSVATYFENLNKLIQTNDGTRSFIYRTVDCHDQSAPFNDSQETRIAITHGDHMISQITDGFLTFKVKLQLQLTGIADGFVDNNNICKIFVGWKSSNQILDQLQIMCRNLSTDYQQNECVREGAAYSFIKPQQEKKTKKYTHSLYENVKYYSPSVCGTYINIQEFKDNRPHDVEFEVNLPFDNILALQAFDLYPNRICGDIELKFYVKPKGLVWCMIDPMNVKDYKEVCEGDTIDLDLTSGNLSALFKHAFTQINNSATIINDFRIETTTVGEGTVNKAIATKGACLLQCVGMSIQSLKSNMYGFNVKAESLEKIYEIFRTPQFIPSQYLEYNAFPLAATASGIQSTINMPVSNASCISSMFPKHDNDYTVFENPVYDNVQLTVNGRNLPDEVVSTQGARFLQYQLIASDLSGGLECTKEYEDSMVMAKNTKEGTRYSNCLSDGTSFMFNVQCERNNAGYTFDGFDSNGQNIPIQLKGNPIYTGVNDTYYNVDPEGTQHPPPPQIWLCRDTYFIASVNGLQYMKDGCPEGSQA